MSGNGNNPGGVGNFGGGGVNVDNPGGGIGGAFSTNPLDLMVGPAVVGDPIRINTGLSIATAGGNSSINADGDIRTKNLHATRVNAIEDVVLGGGDCAEAFDMAGDVEPGSVMVVGENGSLVQCDKEYDKRVAGVISGAGSYKPGIILGKKDLANNDEQKPIALIGRVYCKVDADYGEIEVSDLLTTSKTSGYAMKAQDPLKAFGSVIGKALSSLKDGKDMLPVLVALQ
jgi:hypothetical protein